MSRVCCPHCNCIIAHFFSGCPATVFDLAFCSMQGAYFDGIAMWLWYWTQDQGVGVQSQFPALTPFQLNLRLRVVNNLLDGTLNCSLVCCRSAHISRPHSSGKNPGQLQYKNPTKVTTLTGSFACCSWACQGKESSPNWRIKYIAKTKKKDGQG